MSESFDLDRFVEAQRRVYADVLAELRRGRKTGHWIWYIFPQIQGLGASPTSRRYALASIEEARAYLAHPVLGARLRECIELALRIEDRTARQIFGYPDDLKFRSCLTLFAHAKPDERIFVDALDRYCDGEADPLTIRVLESGAV